MRAKNKVKDAGDNKETINSIISDFRNTLKSKESDINNLHLEFERVKALSSAQLTIIFRQYHIPII